LGDHVSVVGGTGKKNIGKRRGKKTVDEALPPVLRSRQRQMSHHGPGRFNGRSWGRPPPPHPPHHHQVYPGEIAELPGSATSPYFTRRFSAASLPQQPAPSPPAKRFIAVGIDFGTTFSGVSWAYSADPDIIHEVRQWPCAGQLEKEKDEVQVPTQIDLVTRTWGYKVPQTSTPLRWFKLLLLQDEDIKPEIRESPYLSDARRQTSRLGTDGVIDLVADYLRWLWEHARTEIEREMGGNALQELPFKIGLTIPAIWPQYARNHMKEAARRAGILEHRAVGDTAMMLVEEPEAAALATLFERKGYPEMEVGTDAPVWPRVSFC
jgi:hypothetical protein